MTLDEYGRFDALGLLELIRSRQLAPGKIAGTALEASAEGLPAGVHAGFG
jgi:hypothetical protein